MKNIYCLSTVKRYTLSVEMVPAVLKSRLVNFLDGMVFAIKAVGDIHTFEFTEFPQSGNIIIRCDSDNLISALKTELSNFNLTLES